MDVFSVGLQVAFAAVFVVVLLRYLGDRRPVNRDLVIVAGSVVGWYLVSTIVAVWPDVATTVGRLTPVFILAQPFLTLRLVRHFSPVGRNLQLSALAWYVVALAIAFGVGTRGNVVAAVVIVGYFVVFQTTAAVMLARAAGVRIGYARSRLRLATIATLLFAGAILVAGIGTASTPPEAEMNPTFTLLGRVVSLAAGLGYLVAFMPPQPLRRLQQRATAYDLGHELIAAPEGDPDAVWQALVESAGRVTDAWATAVALGDPPVVTAVDGTPPEPFSAGSTIPLVDGVPDAGGDARFAVPIGESTWGRLGWLIVFVGGDSLFLEDDRVLLGFLAEQAARSAERQQAIRDRGNLASELEDASHELAESKAQLEGEARFRVALEAHPGMLLVVDPDGRIGYANEQALASLGYTREEIGSVHLADLLSTSPTHQEQPRGVMPAEARRRDGTVLPVDYATSSFESNGERYSIAVLTDISERLQSERLRDTFIGMLSHELRTPVTAIYGGSQVLLGRGDRLDPDTSRELIADVASEAERLHRLIENLLVLARVERGQDLAGGEPVLLQRILPLIVDRERVLWPDTAIEMVVPPGLPTVRGHDGYVGQVVRNLLSNAAKYAGAGASVEIVAESGAGGVTVRVLDSGQGLDPTHVEHLFDLYYRAPGAADRAPGAGIGLFVCRHIVTGLGGTIWAQARPGGGAEFGFRLPIYEPDDDNDGVGEDRPGMAAAIG